MKVTNQERVREFRGTSIQVFGGGTFTAVNLHVHVKNFTIDALATVWAILKGENFVYDGKLTILKPFFLFYKEKKCIFRDWNGRNFTLVQYAV